LYPHLFRS
jgi:hypothetical protein